MKKIFFHYLCYILDLTAKERKVKYCNECISVYTIEVKHFYQHILDVSY